MSDYIRDAILRGYVWECACGELYRHEQHANTCRKCRDYLIDHEDRPRAVNLSTLYPEVSNGPK